MSRKVTLPVGALTLLASIASTGFTIFFATLLTLKQVPMQLLALPSASVNFLNVLSIFYVFARQHIGKHGIASRRPTLIIILVLSLIVSLLANLSSLALVLWMHFQPLKLRKVTFDQYFSTLIVVEIAVLAVAVVTHTTFLVLCWQYRRIKSRHRTTLSEHSMNTTEDKGRPSTASTSFKATTSPYHWKQGYSDSPTASNFSDEAKASLRSGLQESSQPATSSTALIRQNPVVASKITTEGIVDGTDLETTEQDPEEPRNALRSGRSRKLRRISSPAWPLGLEPIPGSRPNSPGHPLEGPFPPQQSSSNVAEFADGTSGRNSMASEDGARQEEVRIPPRMRPRHQATRSQEALPVDESHIHPLFRTCSPQPAPSHTEGTIVTASAYGGTYMTPSSVSRASSRSRPESPVGWPLTEPRSRAGSFRGRSREGSFSHPGSPLVNSLNREKSRSLDAIASKAQNPSVSEEVPPVPSPVSTSEDDGAPHAR